MFLQFEICRKKVIPHPKEHEELRVLWNEMHFQHSLIRKPCVARYKMQGLIASLGIPICLFVLPVST